MRTRRIPGIGLILSLSAYRIGVLLMSFPSLGHPRGRLETWLSRKLQHGHLKDLPLYHPIRGGPGQPPERYARLLLTRLHDTGLASWDQECLRDDGRAFRGWVEAMLIDSMPLVGFPSGHRVQYSMA